MTYSPECVAAFEAKFVGIRRRAEGAGFWFDFDAGAYAGHEKYKPQIDEANGLLYAFAANWERVRELENLIVHASVHSAYPECGRDEMSSDERALFDEVLDRNSKLLEKGNE